MYVNTFTGNSISNEAEAAIEAADACNEFLREKHIARKQLIGFKVNTATHIDENYVRFSCTITIVTEYL